MSYVEYACLFQPTDSVGTEGGPEQECAAVRFPGGSQPASCLKAVAGGWTVVGRDDR